MFIPRYSSAQETIAMDILRLVGTNSNPAIRTEAYCQLVKQLRENPSAQSVALVCVLSSTTTIIITIDHH